MSEAQYSTVSYAVSRYQKHWATELYKSCAMNNVCVCARKCVLIHMWFCICDFCGFAAFAPGPINISVSHEDIL